MPARRPSRPFLVAFLFAIMVITPVTFFTALSWLKLQSEGLVLLLSAVAAVVTIGASFALAILHDRRMDEWNRSNARFSSQWGWTAGACLVSLLLAVPPIRDGIIAVMGNLAGVPDPDQKLVILTFTFGFMSVVLAQLICTAVLSTAWAYWKSRPAQDLS